MPPCRSVRPSHHSDNNTDLPCNHGNVELIMIFRNRNDRQEQVDRAEPHDSRFGKFNMHSELATRLMATRAPSLNLNFLYGAPSHVPYL